MQVVDALPHQSHVAIAERHDGRGAEQRAEDAAQPVRPAEVRLAVPGGQQDTPIKAHKGSMGRQ